jgi:hypothetical protein
MLLVSSENSFIACFCNSRSTRGAVQADSNPDTLLGLPNAATLADKRTLGPNFLSLGFPVNSPEPPRQMGNAGMPWCLNQFSCPGYNTSIIRITLQREVPYYTRLSTVLPMVYQTGNGRFPEGETSPFRPTAAKNLQRSG